MDASGTLLKNAILIDSYEKFIINDSIDIILQLFDLNPFVCFSG